MININTKIEIKNASDMKPKIKVEDSNNKFDEVLKKTSEKFKDTNKKDDEKLVSSKDLNKETTKEVTSKEPNVKNETKAENNTEISDKESIDNNVTKDDNEKIQVKPEELEGLLNILSNLLNVNSNESMENITTEDIKAIQSLMVDIKDVLEGLKSGGKIDLKELGVDLSKEIDKLMNNDAFKGKIGKENLNVLNNMLKEVSNELQTENIKLTTEEEGSFKNALEKLNTAIDNQKTKGGSREPVKNTDKNNSLNSGTTINNNVDAKTTNTANEEDFNESNNKGQTQKPADLKIKTEDELDVKVKSEEKVLDKILNDDSDNSDKFSLFQKRLNVSRDMEVKPEVRVVEARNLKTDIIKSVKFMATNAMKELTVKIYPKELGAITITLTQSEGTMKATLKPTSRETYSLLMQNADEMKKMLGDQNIKVSTVEIGLYKDDTTFYKDNEFSNEFNNSRDENKGRHNDEHRDRLVALEEEATGEKLSDSNVDMLA